MSMRRGLIRAGCACWYLGFIAIHGVAVIGRVANGIHCTLACIISTIAKRIVLGAYNAHVVDLSLAYMSCTWNVLVPLETDCRAAQTLFNKHTTKLLSPRTHPNSFHQWPNMKYSSSTGSIHHQHSIMLNWSRVNPQPSVVFSSYNNMMLATSLPLKGFRSRIHTFSHSWQNWSQDAWVFQDEDTSRCCHHSWYPSRGEKS